jgi:SET family sugar efflux transporter-like MFS transporter
VNRAPRSSSAFASLAGAVLLLGIADSMVGSYAVLFAADEVGLDPVQVGVFVSAPAVGGILVSSLLGRRFDRRPTRRYATLVAVGGALGLSAMAVSRSFVVLVVVALTLMGPLSAAFPQLFTLARVVLGDGSAGRRSAPLLRSGWSLAWAIGPLLGAAVLARSGYPALLLAAAATLLLTAVLTLTVPRPRTAAANADRDEPSSTAQTPSVRMGRLPLALLVAGVAAFFTSMYAGSVALPLFVTRALHQPDSAVGALYSACAAVEVVAALALAALPPRVSQRALIIGGMVAFIVYFALTVVAGGMPLLLAGQVARGIGIAIVGAAGIRFFQEALAPETGRATTLFSNASTAGSLVAGVLAGAAVRAVGYTSALALCGGLAVLATVLFVAGSSPRMRARDSEPEVVLPSAAG